MKSLLILIAISVFSFIAFGQEEKPAEQAEAPEVSEEAKTTEEKKPMAEEKQVVKEAKPVEEAKTTEEKKPMAEEKQVVKEAKPAEAKPAAEEATAVEENPAAVQEADNAEASTVQAGVKYECDGGKSYTLHEPGVSDESHLCELDAGHTEVAADWYALNQASFCREKLQELIELYNCTVR